ncbi:MAG: RimK family alpha-L-glutamate ligase [Candidatus Bathyarchaeota archaeon]|nr:RimK family alpha-L-glutamate ligase [Candidatus Bathyarchaeota archaeon]
MTVGIVTRNLEGWSSTQLREALTRRGVPYACFTFPMITAQIGGKPFFSVSDDADLQDMDLLHDLDALLIRPIGRGSLEELVFRMDMLYKMEREGFYILNPAESIEHCADKYDIIAVLADSSVPVPRTFATENPLKAAEAFKQLGNDVILKPIFGSRGVGITRINDPEVALTIFKAISFHHGVIYLQEFVPHGNSDIRAFVIGDQVVASMKREAADWKTNYSQGARPEPTTLSPDLEELAVKASKAVGCKISGVDIMVGPNGPKICDVNSQPGWKGLQLVTQVNIADEIINYLLCELKK